MLKNVERLAEIMAANYSEDLKNEVEDLMISGMSDTEISRVKKYYNGYPEGVA